MKKTIALFLAVAMLLTGTSCGKKVGPVDGEPKIEQMKSICELSVMECYYHNVAKFKEEDAAGALWWKKDKHFWVEYSGIVKLGVDASLISLEVSDTKITITLPAAKVLGCKVDSSSLNENSYIVDQDSAAISAEDEVEAFAQAQSQLEEQASNDRALLSEAQRRVQILLYIINIGDAVGKKYSIQWICLGEEREQTEQLPLEDPQNTEDPEQPLAAQQKS